MKLRLILLLILYISSYRNSDAQITLRNYKQPDEQTFYVSTDSTNQKFKAGYPKRTIKIKTTRDYAWFKYNQVFVSQGGYDGRLLNDDYTCSYKNNNLKVKGSYKNGLRAGGWFEWNEDGTLKEIANWRTGLRNGARVYYNNGLVIKTETYRKGILNGKSIRYNGKVQEAVYYHDGAIRPIKIKKRISDQNRDI